MALHLPIGPLKTLSELELVPRCEPRTYQPISRRHNHCVVGAGEIRGSSINCRSINSISAALHNHVVRAFAHGAMGRRIDPSWGGPIELFLVPASAPRLV